ncbi:hypothetical protein [Brevundimonas sp. SORGH_AS_0993]|uniref:hypothetical protein n=1 Tax=Brevundimonas sp. SORGH_AS_0993 TaxID=3041794 RepID=UPI002786BBF3|nr:hypothetical protein [Brevundimonas sp. SORGH_AS_0993]MDQ1154801.1 hypothetical protein [Brevundimonas sp. SORGH_AS_0993]
MVAGLVLTGDKPVRLTPSILTLWIPLAACVLLVTGCHRTGPADPGGSAPGAPPTDVIDAVPLAPEETPSPAPRPRPRPSTPAPEQPKPAETPSEEPQATIPEGPDMAPVRVPVSEVACRDAIGASAAARLVERCIQVSPATRPPCNAANPCALIQNEIDRSCRLSARDGAPPAACKS